MFTCNICQEEFDLKINLQRHYHVHLNQYSCDICHKQFNDEDELQKHYIVHSKRYICDICQRSYVSEKNFEDHLNTHIEEEKYISDEETPDSTGNKKYACEMCNKGFVLKENLKKHLLFHFNNELSCDICLKHFKRKTHLRQHYPTHFKGKALECGICYKSFTEKHQLQEHAATHIYTKLKPFSSKLKENKNKVEIIDLTDVNQVRLDITDKTIASVEKKHFSDDSQNSMSFVDNILMDTFKTNFKDSILTTLSVAVKQEPNDELNENTCLALSKDSTIEANMDCPGVSGKESITELSKDSTVELSKDSAVELSKDSIVELSKDSVAGSSKDCTLGISKDTIAELITDSTSGSNKDTNVGLNKEFIMEINEDAQEQAARKFKIIKSFSVQMTEKPDSYVSEDLSNSGNNYLYSVTLRYLKQYEGLQRSSLVLKTEKLESNNISVDFFTLIDNILTAFCNSVLEEQSPHNKEQLYLVEDESLKSAIHITLLNESAPPDDNTESQISESTDKTESNVQPSQTSSSKKQDSTPVFKKPKLSNDINENLSSAEDPQSAFRINSNDPFPRKDPALCESNWKSIIQEKFPFHVPTRAYRKNSIIRLSGSTKDARFACRECHKVFHKKVNAQRHYRAHFQSKAHSCVVCNKNFLYKHDLKRHYFVHTKEKNFSCQKCSKTFKRIDNLREHSVMHTENNFHSCEICHKEFIGKRNLIKHYLVHNKQYLCEICQRGFPQPSKLKKHMLSHATNPDRAHERPYVCDVCSKSFKKMGSLNKHMLIHSEEAHMYDLENFDQGDNLPPAKPKPRSSKRASTRQKQSSFITSEQFDSLQTSNSLNPKEKDVSKITEEYLYENENIHISFLVSSSEQVDTNTISPELYTIIDNIHKAFPEPVFEKCESLGPKSGDEENPKAIVHFGPKPRATKNDYALFAVSAINEPGLSKKFKKQGYILQPPQFQSLSRPKTDESELPKDDNYSEVISAMQSSPACVDISDKQDGEDISDKPESENICGKVESDGSNKPDINNTSDDSMAQQPDLKDSSEDPILKPGSGVVEFSKSYVDNTDIRVLILTSESSNEVKYACSMCHKIFDKKTYVQKHSQIHYKNKAYTCQMCYKGFIYKNDLERHYFVHIEERPFSCEICMKGFKRKDGLNEHMFVHTGEKPYSCEICNKRFALKQKLQKHKLVHNKDYPCDFCDRSFYEKKKLQKHLMTHSPGYVQKIYPCAFCDSQFKWRRSLRKHLKKHVKKEVFACDICQDHFETEDELLLHLPVHDRRELNKITLKSENSCDICQDHFETEDELLLHLPVHERWDLSKITLKSKTS